MMQPPACDWCGTRAPEPGQSGGGQAGYGFTGLDADCWDDG